MAFYGYLLRFGDTIFPMKYILVSTYTATPDQRLDVDTYRDADGVLRRNVLAHTATKITFQTPAITLTELNDMQTIIKDATTSDIERKVHIAYWDDETSAYKAGDFYMPDISYTIRRTTEDNIYYDSVQFTFIEY